MTTTPSTITIMALSAKDMDLNAETMINLSLLDPPHYGWTAGGGIADLLPPVERARRKATREAFLKKMRRKERIDTKKLDKVEAASAPGNAVSETLDTDLIAVASVAASPADQDNSKTSSANPAENFLSETRLAPSDATTGGNPEQIAPSAFHSAAHTLAGSSSATDMAVANKISSSQYTNTPTRFENPLIVNPAFAPVLIQGHELYGLDSVQDNSGHTTFDSNNPYCGKGLSTVNTFNSTLAPQLEEMPAPQAVTTPAPQSVTALTPIAGLTSGIQSPTNESKQPVALTISAIDEEGVVDMYTYHRGREGSEPRDAETGELICDVGPTDSTFGWDQKCLSTAVTVSFPLGEGDEDFYYYKEVIEWDLTDPRAPTAMAFAANVAHEYGLNFGQTMDLATDIQKQLDEFLENLTIYVTPMTMKDPNERERGKLPTSSRRLQLYGVPVPVVEGGLPLPTKQKQRAVATTRAPTPAPVNQPKPPSIRKLNEGDDDFNIRTDGPYRAEVMKRARLASMNDIEKIARSNGDNVVGFLEERTNWHCHICHSRKPISALFACGTSTHSYCDTHCRDRLGFSIAKPEFRPVTLDHCPICCLRCECTKCQRRLNAVAVEFRKQCISQGVANPEEADFDNILLYTAGRGGGGGGGGGGGTVKKPTIVRVNKTSGFKLNKKKAKIPFRDFPREVCASVDLDPGTATDYLTVFSSEGSFLHKDPCIAATEIETKKEFEDDESNLQEDGSVDYCLICRKPGDLLCCDRCPRAYHIKCIGDSVDPPDGRWECHECLKEKAGLEQDLVDGRSYLHNGGHTSIEKITASLVNFSNSIGFIEGHQILSMIHEMLSKLIDYEFGFIFRAPVDCKFVPTYRKIVKKPMDLGTISSRLENGYYPRKYLNAKLSWDDIIAAVLEDIELVWHNCFTFNLEGSAVYKMAEVQRRRYLEMRRRSFDHLLSDAVKTRVNQFVSACEVDRAKDAPVPKEKTPQPSVPSKYKIEVKVSYGGNRRIVAILDPDSGMLAKLYSSQKSAFIAANFLQKIGHTPEWEPLNEFPLKSYIKSSTHDPSQLLFGYRWLLFDDLQAGSVVFGKAPSNLKSLLQDGKVFKRDCPLGFVEMFDGFSFYIFISIEEALCFSGLPRAVPIDQIRSRFCEMPPGEWKSIVGFNWRRIAPESGNSQGETAANETTTGVGSEKEEVIVKKDSITGRKLLGFKTIAAAHKDWIGCCLNSPMFHQPWNTSMEEFSSKFLDKDGHVDGITWQSMMIEQFTREPNETAQVELESPENPEKERIPIDSNTENALKSPPSSIAATNRERLLGANETTTVERVHSIVEARTVDAIIALDVHPQETPPNLTNTHAEDDLMHFSKELGSRIVMHEPSKSTCLKRPLETNDDDFPSKKATILVTLESATN